MVQRQPTMSTPFSKVDCFVRRIPPDVPPVRSMITGSWRTTPTWKVMLSPLKSFPTQPVERSFWLRTEPCLHPDHCSGRQTDTFTYQAVDSGGAVSRVTTVTISIGNPAPPRHQNPVQHMDVNADGFVSPIDVLLVINFLNLNGPSTPVNTLQDPPPYRDASGDNFITSLDALMVINYLNLNGNGRSGGEGEGEELGDSELVLGWQSVVSRPEDNAVVMMERTSVTGSKTYGPMQSVATPMMISPSTSSTGMLSTIWQIAWRSLKKTMQGWWTMPCSPCSECKTMMRVEHKFDAN